MTYAVFKAIVTNPEALAAYRDQAGAALARHGGKVEQASATPEALDGKPTIPSVTAILSFPDADAARAWINDPELAELHDLRRSAGQTEIMLLA
ncbi:DUF1330 domain-containing protein [Falsiphaeobacter marinintestinus]|uniref:DUF1330 domain-containing protein n=1 Tax=Falsiphaeobacter marinintestinus TaxID=1492905 RepID=UPI001FE97EFB|nr:DUF1330 domain-containing protein [Phaeobacter marinintestinus]